MMVVLIFFHRGEKMEPGLIVDVGQWWLKSVRCFLGEANSWRKRMVPAVVAESRHGGKGKLLECLLKIWRKIYMHDRFMREQSRVLASVQSFPLRQDAVSGQNRAGYKAQNVAH